MASSLDLSPETHSCIFHGPEILKRRGKKCSDLPMYQACHRYTYNTFNTLHLKDIKQISCLVLPSSQKQPILTSIYPMIHCIMHMYAHRHLLCNYLYNDTYDNILYCSFLIVLEPVPIQKWACYPSSAYLCPAASGQG